jgi:hypothetical protein
LVALDQAPLGARGQAECGGGQAVDVAHLPQGGLVKKGQRVGGGCAIAASDSGED